MSDPALARLTALVSDLASGRVLCLGDVMLDTFNRGTVSRISPESPVPVFNLGTEESVPGGAANVARNIASLGGRCVLIGLVGTDAAGQMIATALAPFGAIETHFVPEPQRPTTHKIRYVAQGQHLLRVDSETTEPATEAAQTALIAAALAALPGCRAVVLSDYTKGALTDRVIREVTLAARDQGVPVIVDPKSRDFGRYAGASLLTPNLKEAEAACGLPMRSDAEVVQAALTLIAKAQTEAILITRSEKGMTLVERTGAAQHITSDAREVFDVVGAGDTVIAGLALALAVGSGPELAARLANIAAGIAVSKRGTATVSPDEILGRLEQMGDPRPRHGAPLLLTPEEAALYAEARRRENRKIGFTNGVFDIVHPGHIALLDYCRSTCDCLIVGLNSDASVRRLNKGPERPINGELDRAKVLGAFGTVDAVVLFSEDTPLDLIRVLRPDVLIKGADYSVATVVGADLVLGYGGEVLLAPLVAGKSSTGIIAKARAQEMP